MARHWMVLNRSDLWWLRHIAHFHWGAAGSWATHSRHSRRVLVLDHSTGSARLQRESGQIDAWRHDALVVVRVHADRVALQIEGELAELDVLQLVLVQVRPTPDARVYDVWEALPPRHLQSTVQSALDSDAFAVVRPVGRDGRDQRVQLIALLLQLLHQRLDGSLGKALALPALSVAHQRVDNAETGVRRCGRRCRIRHSIHVAH